MSIIPYNSNNEIVYHDPNLSIVVLHNYQENTIQLVTSVSAQDIFPHNHNIFRPHFVERQEHLDLCCPNCGIVLTDFLDQNNRTEYQRLASAGQIPRRRRSESSFPMEIRDLVPAGFMHQDYFKLLANLPYEHNIIAPPGSESLPSEIFNQGYFDRFFHKIPPGILGSGAHAQVYKVMHMLKNIQLGVYAVKRINVGDHTQLLDQVLNEVLILYELTAKGANENNLIRYNHVWMELGDMKDLTTIYLNNDGHASSTDEKIPYVFILQQYCDGGHLENLIVTNFQKEQFMSPKEKLEAERERRRNQKLHHNQDQRDFQGKKWLSEFEIWKFFRDIANGVNYLHSKGILHRDLKPSNCLLESKYIFDAEASVKFKTLAEMENSAHKLPKVLVSDFGEGKFIDKQHVADVAMQMDDERRGNTGTIEFTDPKLWVYAHYDGSLKERKFAYNFTKASDIYSLGIILCYLCVGELPFANKITDCTDPEKIRGDIARWHEQLTPENFHSWFRDKTIEVRGNISECLNDFEYLIYLMIKNDNEEEILSSSSVMEYLDSMKWGAFIGEERKHSEATITEVPKSGGNEDAELIYEGDTLDLTGDQTVEVNSTETSNSYTRRPNLTSQTRNIVIVFAYISSLAILELLASSEDYNSIRAAKFLNIAGLSSEVLAGGTILQYYICGFCIAFTYYALHQINA